MKKCLAIILALLMGQAAYAGVVPKPSDTDKRVRVAKYEPFQVYDLVAFYGYEIYIQLEEGEIIKSIGLGDPDAWIIEPKEKDVTNFISIRPKEEKPFTNLRITSDSADGERRVYFFAIDAQWPEGNTTPPPDKGVYAVIFDYPTTKSKKQASSQKVSDIKSSLSNALIDKKRNYSYSFAGSESLEPEEVFDDGRFTWIRFAANLAKPAIYFVTEDGSEQMTEGHVEEEWHVIHRIARQFIFRKDNAVAGVFNDAFDAKGRHNRTGTVSPEVQRVLKVEP